jgi:hypothetical protein
MADFYKEDEPFEDVVAAFERGEKALTAPPRGQTAYLDVPWAGPLAWPSDGAGTT